MANLTRRDHDPAVERVSRPRPALAPESAGDPVPSARPRRTAWLRSAISDNVLLAWTTIGYGTAWVAVLLVLGRSPRISPQFIAGQLELFLLLFFCYSVIAHIVVVIRSKPRPGASGPLPSYLNPTSIASALIAMVLCALFMAVFTSWKYLIPLVQPFAWDAELMQLDRWLHGSDPWRLIQPLAGHPPITRFLGFVYGPVWFLTGAAMLGWAAWTKDAAFRYRFYLSFVILWIGLGTIMAIALSSAGPAFYHHIERGEQPFLELLTYLESAAPWVVEVQGRLWRAHENGVQVISSGISAAPSLHIAQLALFAFLTWHSYRAVAWTMMMLTALSMIATVHLGWHYAVDGYMGIIGAYVIVRVVSYRRGASIDPTPQR